MSAKRAPHSEVLSGATFHRANTERGAKTQAAVYAGNGQRTKVAQHKGKWGCWVWPKAKESNPLKVKAFSLARVAYRTPVGKTKDVLTAHGNTISVFHKDGSHWYIRQSINRQDALATSIRQLANEFAYILEAGRIAEDSKELHQFIERVAPERAIWKSNPKRNPESAAIKMREKFTGLPADGTVLVERTEHVHEHLAALGDLIELRGKTIKGQPFVIEFKRSKNPRRKSKDIVGKVRGWVGRRAKAVSGVVKGFSNAWINGKKRNPNGPTILASNEAGTQLFLEGGDQSLNLSNVGLSELAKKEVATIGDVHYITYHSKKKFDGKEEEHDYEHEFSEESKGPRPTLRYDVKNKAMFLDGGVYYVPRPFFGTSPGITD